MDKIVNFQLSLFGSFINIQPNQEITMRLMANLADENMVPGTANVSSVDPVNKKIDTETRLQMVSHNQSWKIVFLQERINIDYDYVGGDVFYSNFEDIFKKGLELLKKTFMTFPNTTGNRIAANARMLMSVMDKESENLFIRRFTTPISSFKNDSLQEWNVHYNAKKSISISEGREEICNNIVDMGNIIGIDAKTGVAHNRIYVSFDINTAPELTDVRFKYTDLSSFAMSAKEEMKTMLSDIEEV